MRLSLLPMIAAATVAGTVAWTPFTSIRDGFAISFPGTPAIAAGSDVPAGTGYRTYRVRRSGTVYSISVRGYAPNGAPEASTKTYATLLRAYASGAHCSLKPSRALVIAGTLALEARCIDRPGKLDHLVDVLISGDRLYLMVAAGPPGSATSPSAARFHESFALVSAATPPPAQTTPSVAAPAASASPSP